MSNYRLDDDYDLLQRIADRDQRAFSDLYERYNRLVFNMALQVTRSPATAEEVTQDVFLQIWRAPDKWDPDKGRFTSWLLSVARYTAIDRIRHEQRHPSLAPELLEQVNLDANGTADRIGSEDGRILHDLLAQLPHDQRQMITMAFFRGMTHSELAAYYDLPLGTVKSRIRLGLEKLKQGWLAASRVPQL